MFGLNFREWALFLLPMILILFVVLSFVETENKALTIKNMERALQKYFGTENYIISVTYGPKRYQVVTEQGIYVVEMNDKHNEVLRALEIQKNQ